MNTVTEKQYQPHQQRVVDEKRELDIKIDKLQSFFSTDIFMSVDEAEQDRLHCQYQVMKAYSLILASRIKAF
jgi:hypothetical protein